MKLTFIYLQSVICWRVVHLHFQGFSFFEKIVSVFISLDRNNEIKICNLIASCAFEDALYTNKISYATSTENFDLSSRLSPESEFINSISSPCSITYYYTLYFIVHVRRCTVTINFELKLRLLTLWMPTKWICIYILVYIPIERWVNKKVWRARYRKNGEIGL